MSNFRIHYIPDETDAVKKWFGGIAEEFLEKIGIRPGFYVVDFGCGAGSYTLPIAKVVGKEGKVYAIDKEQIVLDEITLRAEKMDVIEQIIPVKTNGEFSFPIKDHSIDAAIIFDVLGAIVNRQGLESVKELINEIRRITKSKGLLILSLKHTQNWHVSKDELIGILHKFFTIQELKILSHLHWDFLEEDIIYILEKT